jgi:hypothetical protein
MKGVLGITTWDLGLTTWELGLGNYDLGLGALLLIFPEEKAESDEFILKLRITPP